MKRHTLHAAAFLVLVSAIALAGNSISGYNLLTADELVLDSANQDTFIGRSSAGTVYVGATTGTADGNLSAAQAIFSTSGRFGSMTSSTGTQLNHYAAGLGFGSAGKIWWSDGAVSGGTKDTYFNRQSAGVVGLGTTSGGTDGTLSTGTVLVQEQAFGTPVLSSAATPTTGIALRAGVIEFLFGGTRTSYISASGFFTANSASNFSTFDGSSFIIGSGLDAYISGDGATSGLVTIGTTSGGTDGTLHTGSIATAIATKTATYTTLAGDHTLLFDATSAPLTANLIPVASVPAGTTIIIKKIDSSANAITIDANLAETIDGATTQSLSSQYSSLTIQSDGTTWWIQ